MKREKKCCDKCNKEISFSNFNKHYKSCKGIIEKNYIKIDETWKQENGKYKCPYCEKEYSKSGICTHIWRSHGEGKDFNPFKLINGKYNENRIIWNKGLTKETDDRVKNIGITYSNKMKSGELIPPMLGKNLTEEQKQKVSNGMKLAHKEGRAWNIGKSRWNNKQSYPEIFFTQVIENEFIDKNYKSEYNVGIYSLDFAWIEKKKVIEIDGEQHQRFEEYIERDKRKDLFLIENGWQILRINWKDMYKDTKFYINKAKEFIHN